MTKRLSEASRWPRLTLTLVLLQSICLAACGGGGGSDSAAAPADTRAGSNTGGTGGTGGSGTNTGTGGSSNSASTNTSTSCETATGRVLEVGAGKPYAVPSAAAAVARDGDVVKIAAGDYRGDVATWSVNGLTLCGVGGRARLWADGKNAQGKAIWVVGGSNVTIENIDFHDAHVPDQNGAGIRAEHGGYLVIRNSGFYDNEDGILGGSGSATITIEGSEFARNGYGDGQSHNIYIGQAAKLTVRNSFFHEAKIGHNLKSRAAETHIENSYFMDGPAGTSSYLAEFPNGGVVYLRGNLFQKGPQADNSIAISFGAEGLVWGANTVEMVHNTVVMTRSGGTFLSVASGAQSLTLMANLFAGAGNPGFLTGGFAVNRAVQTNNFTSQAANLPGADNLAKPSFWANAALLGQLQLGSVLDAGYVNDAPAPYQQRAISGGARLVGALQAAP